MAQFCTKCGSPIPDGMRFCTGCGATVGGPPAPAALSPVAPVTPSAVAVPPAPAPAASSGSPVLKILLIVLAIIMFFGLLTAGACVYMVYRAKQRVTQFEKQIQTNLPATTGGQTGVTQPGATGQGPGQPGAPAVDLGAMAYPGATAVEGQSTGSVAGIGIQKQVFLTDDSVDKIVAYYKDKLGSRAMVSENEGKAALQVVGSNGLVTIAIEPDTSSGKTKITIGSITR